MLKELQDFGLSEKEAQIYIASLALGRATADQLAKQAGIKRPTAYVQIEALSKMGLMSTFEEGKKTFFVPESPEGLRRIITKRKEEILSREQELNTLLPELLLKYEGAGERPVVRFFKGKEGVQAMREELLSVQQKEILVMYPHDELTQHFSSEERKSYSERRAGEKIHARMIYNAKEPFTGSRPYSEQRYITEDKLKFKNDIVIFGDNVAITTFTAGLSGVTVHGKEFADSLRSLFEFVWKTLE